MASWLTAEDRNLLGILWPDSDGLIDDDVLNIYLSAAKAACLAFAPAREPGALVVVDDIVQPEEPGTIPDEWRLAQAMQARNIYNAAQASPSSGDFDGGGYGLSSFPLDWQVKQLLRPQMGVGAIV